MRPPVPAACARPAAVGAKPQRPSASAAARLASGTTIVFEPGPLAAAAVSATPAVSSAAQIATPAPHGDVTAQPDRLAAALGDQPRERHERVEDGRAVLARRGAVDLAHRGAVLLAQDAQRHVRAGRAGRPAPCGHRVLGLEAEPLVQRAAHVGREQQDRLRAALAQARARAAGERLADAAAPRVREHAERADPSGRAEARATDAADRAPVAVGDQDVPGGALARERDEAGDGRPESCPREQVADRARLVGAQVPDVGHGREP